MNATPTHVREAMATIAQYLNRPALTEAQLGPYVRALSGLDYDRFSTGMAHWVRTHSPGLFMPATAELLEAIREARLAAEKRTTTDRAPLSAPRDQRPVARDLFTLMGAWLRHELSVDEYRAGLRDLEATYPGLGFGEVAAKLPVVRAQDAASRATDRAFRGPVPRHARRGEAFREEGRHADEGDSR